MNLNKCYFQQIKNIKTQQLIEANHDNRLTHIIEINRNYFKKMEK